MKKIAIAVIAYLLTGMATASEVPKLPLDAYIVDVRACQHVPTRQEGVCVTLAQPNGDFWVVFIQNKETQIITYIEQGVKAIEVWTSDKFGSF